MDPEARRQLLLTRIALNRAAMRVALAEVRHAASMRRLLGSAIGGALWGGGDGEGRRLGSQGWARVAWTLLRRYRVAAAALGLMPSVAGHWRGLARLTLVALAAGGAWRLWRAGRHDKTPQVDPAGSDKA